LLFLTTQIVRRGAAPQNAEAASLAPWPAVTIQLPVYNEQHVIERLIDACARLDYPSRLLQIHILDDSDDATTELARQRARHWRRLGRDVTVLQRNNRHGYKAGALADALPQASGEFIAIFDADFLPPPDFLRRALPSFLLVENQRLGFLQARWEHLNRDYSLLTQCQALALDGHFAVEQPARGRCGLPFGFNGAAGIWRRACIEDTKVGGWQEDTLCEDLDLSYRAQLVGWRGLFVEDLAAPAEIPPQLTAFKRQQFRWAKGSIQSLCKLAKSIVKGRWPLFTRLMALLHLSNYLLHPTLLLMLVLTLPLLWLQIPASPLLAPLSLTSLASPWLHWVAQRRLHPKQGWRHLRNLPALALIGVGLSYSNSIAVGQALWSAQTGAASGPFLRTPKFRLETAGDDWRASHYRLPLNPTSLAESALALYAFITVYEAWQRGQLGLAFFMTLYAAGFSLVVSIELWQMRQSRRTLPAKPAEPLRAAPIAERETISFSGTPSNSCQMTTTLVE
jgi:glycosyltransferase involved in cell wall biosynthesis